ncbi:MAG: hypothetical protein U0638_01475 [Phycisphaerales bacterium]
MSDDQRDAIESTSSTAVSDSGSPVKAEPAAALCPYCGSITPTGARCSHCRGLLDPLSRQATTNTMGPWFIRDEAQPFRPGCSYHTLVSLIQRGKITRTTIIRGPSTRQFWMFAGKVPGVAHLLGVCHSCQEESHADDFACNNCGAVFTAEEDRQRLGLGAVMEVPGQALPEGRPMTKEHKSSVARRVDHSPNPRPMSAIMDDAAPWQVPPRKSPGMLVGGVILSIAALAAAGFAVKTWIEANRPYPMRNFVVPAPQLQPPSPAELASPTNPSSPTPTPALSPTPREEIQPALPNPSSQPTPDAGHPQFAEPAASAQLSWSAGWRLARGLP